MKTVDKPKESPGSQLCKGLLGIGAGGGVLWFLATLTAAPPSDQATTPPTEIVCPKATTSAEQRAELACSEARLAASWQRLKYVLGQVWVDSSAPDMYQVAAHNNQDVRTAPVDWTTETPCPKAPSDNDAAWTTNLTAIRGSLLLADAQAIQRRERHLANPTAAVADLSDFIVTLQSVCRFHPRWTVRDAIIQAYPGNFVIID